MKATFRKKMLEFSDVPFTFHKESDFWRIFLDDGVYRELTVHSHKQTPAKVEEQENVISVFYDKLLAEDGKTYDVGFTVRIESRDGGLYFDFDIENKSDARVNEVMCPYFEIASSGVAEADERFFAPDGMGCRIRNPRAHLEKYCHTEYISSDYHGITKIMPYPGSITMPWVGLQAGESFLYVGFHDEDFKLSAITLGRAPRNAPASASKLSFAVSHYPAAEKGEKLSYVGGLVKLFEKGSWHDAVRFYREWSERTWFKAPEVPEWVKSMTGWQRIIMKHQYGEIFFKYKDLPEIYKQGAKYGINSLLVFGWWKGCFDNHYPEYEVDPELGGEEELKNAIAEIQALGGTVQIYANGNLIDMQTEFYKATGHKCSAKSIDGNPYIEQYRFSNEGTVLRTYGNKAFVTACPSTVEWQERMLEVGDLLLSFGSDCAFYDQLSCCFRMCFDKSHLHGNRIDRFAASRMELMNKILAKCRDKGGKAFGSEWANDRLTMNVDFTHGCNPGHYYDANAFPDIFREAFPEYIMSNRLVHDEKQGYKKHLNYAFVEGYIFDVSVNRGRVCGMEGYPEYSEYVKMLIDLKEKYHDFFYGGTYKSADDLPLPHEVFAANYISGEHRITAICNNTSNDVTVSVYGKTVTLSPEEATVVES